MQASQLIDAGEVRALVRKRNRLSEDDCLVTIFWSQCKSWNFITVFFIIIVIWKACSNQLSLHC